MHMGYKCIRITCMRMMRAHGAEETCGDGAMPALLAAPFHEMYAVEQLLRLDLQK